MSNIVIILAVVAVLVLFVVSIYNRLVRLNVSVDEAFAQIEVQLKRRSDLIPNLVETVKGYASHESATFEKVVNARAKATTATTVADVAAADGAVTQALRGLLADGLRQKTRRSPEEGRKPTAGNDRGCDCLATCQKLREVCAVASNRCAEPPVS